ncbi:MAG: MBL fold metallo-hydrolase [Kiritimatiellia bacterium]|jgi:7,8-dihydropterin-6-yl-methyl-4-(beta-D-ribofuranosyl)aminobenzene 5'-phosphate synthase
MIKITVIAENTATRPEILGEHGLAFWVETSAGRALFDAGPALSFRHNVSTLGIPLERADVIVLSHGHSDHTGGLAWALAAAGSARVFMHPTALLPRFSRHGGRPRAIGMPEDARSALQYCGRLEKTSQPVEILPGVCTTGFIPRKNTVEDTGGPFFLDAAGAQPDPIEDDQALWVDTPTGLVVVLGCAHAGVINTLEHIRNLAGERPIRALLGGMHLAPASPSRLEWTIAELRKFQPKQIMPMHCTGISVTAALWNGLPDCCVAAGAGATYEF